MNDSLTIGVWVRKIPGSIGIGLQPGPAVDHIMDMTKMSFPDNSFSNVYSYDAIEHLSWAEIPIALKEMFRVLKPKGRVELCTHDFDILAQRYLTSDQAGRIATLRNIYGGQTFPSDFHRCGYNFESLSASMSVAGFINLKRVSPSCTWECAELTVEGFKP